MAEFLSQMNLLREFPNTLEKKKHRVARESNQISPSIFHGREVASCTTPEETEHPARHQRDGFGDGPCAEGPGEDGGCHRPVLVVLQSIWIILGWQIPTANKYVQYLINWVRQLRLIVIG